MAGTILFKIDNGERAYPGLSWTECVGENQFRAGYLIEHPRVPETPALVLESGVYEPDENREWQLTRYSVTARTELY